MLLLLPDSVAQDVDAELSRAAALAGTVHRLRGYAFFGMRRWQEAKVKVDKAIKAMPDDVPTRIQFIACLQANGEFTKAIKACELLLAERDKLKLDEETIGSLYNDLGLCYLTLGPRNLKSALDCLNKSVSMQRDLPNKTAEQEGTLANALMNRSLVLLHSGSKEAAKRDLDEAVKTLRRFRQDGPYFEEHLAKALKNRGTFFHDLKDVDESLSIFQDLVQGNDGLVFELAAGYMNCGEHHRLQLHDPVKAESFHNKAIELLEKLVSNDASSHEAKHILGGASMTAVLRER